MSRTHCVWTNSSFQFFRISYNSCLQLAVVRRSDYVPLSFRWFMVRLCGTWSRLLLTTALLSCILLALYNYTDTDTLNSSLNSIQEPVLRFIDYNEYVKPDVTLTHADFVVDTQRLLDHIHKKCKKNGVTKNRNFLPVAVTIAVPQYNLLYVSNPKTGSTSFKKFILRLNGDTTPYDEMLHVHANRKGRYLDLQYMNEQIYQNLTLKEIISKKMYVVGFVRNPITRLISGFRNKVLRAPGSGYNERIYRELQHSASDIERFKVFIRLVTSGEISDHHFTPQWNKMRICSLPYNMLGQTETTSDNIRKMMKETGIEGVEFPGSRSQTG